MPWDMVLRRQAVTAWRDEQLLAAYDLFHGQVRKARAEFEQRVLEHARLYDTIWNPTGFAEPNIDEELQKTLPQEVVRFLDVAATALLSITPEFKEIVEALRRSDTVDWPRSTSIEVEAPSSDEDAIYVDDVAPVPNSSDEQWVIQKKLETFADVAGDVVKKGTAIVQKQADVLADRLQDRTGLRERVRVAAQRRIASHWTGEEGDVQSVLTQLTRIIESTTETARMKAL